MNKGIKSLLRKFGFHLEPEQKTVFDVVCGMEIPAPQVEYASTHNSEVYYFCSQSCKDHFDGEPENYAPNDAKQKKDSGNSKRDGGCCH